ncbi:MAG: Maf family nucleotide pyrophosphatase [Gammaproteobacteria bacterium]|nr:Maf family nucleotide pyrophosphatase [Gammaproteobacteria bacterium]
MGTNAVQQQDPFQIYLASGSPRRQELLDQIGVRYQLIKQDVPEEVQPGETPEMFVTRLALEKARAGMQSLKAQNDKPVLGADTAVVVDDQILGKPIDREDGLNMLSLLSGRCHKVYSAVALISPSGQEQCRVNCSQVCFRELSMQDREDYWATGECADKAGAYGIQGQAAVFITKLEGSYSGVMGLPLFETAELLHTVAV